LIEYQTSPARLIVNIHMLVSLGILLQAPWPHVDLLAVATAEAGKLMVPRLAVYPFYIDELWQVSKY
jgi:hypothetical protein